MGKGAFPNGSLWRALLLGIPALALATKGALLAVSPPYDDMILEFGDGREVPRILGAEDVVIPALFVAFVGGIGVWWWRRFWIDLAEWRTRGSPLQHRCDPALSRAKVTRKNRRGFIPDGLTFRNEAAAHHRSGEFSC